MGRSWTGFSRPEKSGFFSAPTREMLRSSVMTWIPDTTWQSIPVKVEAKLPQWPFVPGLHNLMAKDFWLSNRGKSSIVKNRLFPINNY
jgi:hypothetical protein